MVRYEGWVEKRIFEAAKTLFASKGHEETKFQEIAAKAGTSESQIVKYFGSKAGILDALFSKARTYINEPFERVTKEIDDPVLILEKVLTLLVDFYEKDPELLKIYLFSRRYYTQVSPQELTHGARFRKLLASIFKRGQKEKVFWDDFKPDVAASAFWGTIQGMMKDRVYSESVDEFPKLSFEEMKTVLGTVIKSFAK